MHVRVDVYMHAHMHDPHAWTYKVCVRARTLPDIEAAQRVLSIGVLLRRVLLECF